MKKYLMVCLGNICRSPLAEGILRHHLQGKAIVDSCGTGNYHINQAPDKRSIKVAKEHQIDISELKGRQFSLKDFEDFDQIYVMDEQNLENILKLAKNQAQKDKVSLILDENKTLGKEVPDPYFGEYDGFEKVYNMLDETCLKIVKKYHS